MCGFMVGERFKSHPNLKKVYYTYLLIAAAPFITASALVTWIIHMFAPPEQNLSDLLLSLYACWLMIVLG